jgi:uncharacterized protein (TIGR02246 family)
MKRIATLIGGAAIALMAIACNQPADTHDADVQAIKDNEAHWNQDWASRDPDKIMIHYADDAVVMAPGSPATSGTDAIRSEVKQMVSDPTLSLKFKPSRIEVAKAGDLAFTQGSYTLTLTDPKTEQMISDHGSYVATYRKLADGAWKAVSDIASSEVPPPAPAPAPAKKH